MQQRMIKLSGRRTTITGARVLDLEKLQLTSSSTIAFVADTAASKSALSLFGALQNLQF